MYIRMKISSFLCLKLTWLRKKLNFWKNALKSNPNFFDKNKHEHTDINMLDVMYANKEVTCLNTFGTGDKNVMGV